MVNLCHLTSSYIEISVIHQDSACNQRRSPKTEFFSMFLLIQVFSESYGHQSLCSIHVIKPTNPNFEHSKYEPDISSSARKKGGVKIASDFRTPCRFDFGFQSKFHQNMLVWCLNYQKIKKMKIFHRGTLPENFEKCALKEGDSSWEARSHNHFIV